MMGSTPLPGAGGSASGVDQTARDAADAERVRNDEQDGVIATKSNDTEIQQMFADIDRDYARKNTVANAKAAADAADGKAVAAQATADTAKDGVAALSLPSRTRSHWANGEVIQIADYADYNACLAQILLKDQWAGDRATLQMPLGATPMLSSLVVKGKDYGRFDLQPTTAFVAAGNIVATVAGAVRNWSVTIPMPTGHGIVINEDVRITPNSAGPWGANISQFFGTWLVTGVGANSITFNCLSSYTTLVGATIPMRVTRIRTWITTAFGGPKFVNSIAPVARSIMMRSTTTAIDVIENVGLSLFAGSRQNCNPDYIFPTLATAYQGYYFRGFTKGLVIADAGSTYVGSVIAVGQGSHGIDMARYGQLTSVDVISSANSILSNSSHGMVAQDGAMAKLGDAAMPALFCGNGDRALILGYGCDVTVHHGEAYGNGLKSGSGATIGVFENGICRQFAGGFTYDGSASPTPNTVSATGAALWRY